MRKLLLTLFLCIPWMLWGQTSYEYRYWFDADEQSLQTGTSASSACNLDLDINHLLEGFHTFHFQVIDDRGRWSSSHTRMFYKQPIETENYDSYCYWFDDAFAERKTLEQTQGIIDIDVSALLEGFHYIHVMALQEGEVYRSSQETRMFYKVSPLTNADSLECILTINGKEYRREKVLNSDGLVDCSIDVNDLERGFYHLQAKLVTLSGEVKSNRSAMFYRARTSEEINSMKFYYSFDDGTTLQAAEQIAEGLYQFNLDVSELERGKHYVTGMLVAEDGIQTQAVRDSFDISFYKLHYMIDGEIITTQYLEPGTEIIPLEEPVKEGFVFSGWSDVPETMPEEDVTVTGSFVRLGDVDVNGNVTVGDVVITGNYILKRNPEVFYFKAADINRDAEITMSDVVAIVDIVLDEKDTVATGRTRSCIAGLDLGKATVKHETAAIPMSLANNTPYCAFQADVVLPEGIALESVTLAARAQGTHRVTWKKQANGRVRMLVYAADNAAFRGNAGELVTLNLSGFSVGDPELDVHLENVIFATPEGYENFMDNATSIINPAAGMTVYARGGTLFVESDEAQTLHLYNLQGQLVKVLHLHEGVNTYANLPAGVYILNGVKVVIDK